jgi:hypothetical protein
VCVGGRQQQGRSAGGLDIWVGVAVTLLHVVLNLVCCSACNSIPCCCGGVGLWLGSASTSMVHAPNYPSAAVHDSGATCTVTAVSLVHVAHDSSSVWLEGS